MKHDSPRRHTAASASGLACLLLALSVLVFSLAGCSSDSEPTEEEPTVTNADDVLHKMIEVYRTAESYSDRGIVRLQYRLEGQRLHDEGEFAVTFARPNMLQVRAYQMTMVSDGQLTHAIIADQQSGDLDGQVLEKPTPPVLTLGTLYEDPVILNTIAGGMGGPPATLEMLLGEKPLAHVFEPTASRRLLDEGEVRGHTCHRIEVRLVDASLVFWIDRESFVLRRLEYPSDGLARQMAETMDCRDVSLVADFHDACINGPLFKDEFRFQVPDNAKLVRRFVVPPQPLASDLYGRLPSAFFFSDLEGQKLTQDSLLGQVAVLVWFNNHPASQIAVQQVDQVSRRQPATSRVSFHAVCTEPTHVGNSELKALASQWQTNLPMVRDLEAFGRDVFRIPWAPTLVILDAKGIVQAYEVGANPQLAENLTEMLRQLAEGKSLAKEMLSKYGAERATYARRLAEFSVASPSQQHGRSEDATDLRGRVIPSSSTGGALPTHQIEPAASGDRAAAEGGLPSSHR